MVQSLHAASSLPSLSSLTSSPNGLRYQSCARRHTGPVTVRAVAEKDRVIQELNRMASNAASALKAAAAETQRALPLRISAEELRAQSQAKAEQLRLQAQQAAQRLQAQAESARTRLSSLLEEADRNKAPLVQAVQQIEAPEPIKNIAETAIVAHGTEAVKKGAVIHDFCLGITYGGLLVAGGLVWFVATGSLNAVRFGIILGSVLLAAAIGSLNAWRAGRSCTPYIAVQGVTAYLLFARGAARYAQTKALFPTGIMAAASIAMVAFYVYVVLAGGNPPPKAKTAPAQ